MMMMVMVHNTSVAFWLNYFKQTLGARSRHLGGVGRSWGAVGLMLARPSRWGGAP